MHGARRAGLSQTNLSQGRRFLGFVCRQLRAFAFGEYLSRSSFYGRGATGGN